MFTHTHSDGHSQEKKKKKKKKISCDRKFIELLLFIPMNPQRSDRGRVT